MLKTTSITINSSSTVETSNGQELVQTFSGSISERGNVSVSRYVQNKSMYEANKELSDADFVAFQESVDMVANNLEQEV